MLAFITGSGFYNLEALQDAETIAVETPYGPATFNRGRWNGGPEVLFLPRHGADHSVPPHVINYRANIWALHDAGASAIIATAVVGAISPSMQPGDFVVIDDFLDFTTGRASTFFDAAGNLTHTEMGDPYDAALRTTIVEATQAAQVPVHIGATYCATNGPRFETKAEIAMMARLGGHVVGMTGCPETVLANELDIDYASIGVVSNMAAGISEQEFTMDEIMQVLADAKLPLEQVLSAVVERQNP